jgi:O-antigen/teichoic acid export membrane protein
MTGLNNFTRRFLSIFTGKSLTTLVAFASTPIIVRLLGPGGYGDYAAMLSLFTLYMIPVSSGVTEGVQKFVAEDRDYPDWQANVVRFYGLLATGIVGVAVLLVIAVTVVGLPQRIYGDDFTTYFYLLAAFVLVAQFRTTAIRIILGMGLEPISESLKVAKKLTWVILGIVLLAAGYGVSGMLVGHIVASLLVAVVAGYTVVRTVSVRSLLDGLPSSFPYRELMSFNGYNIVLIMLVMSLFHVDVVMLRTLLDGETTGYYKAALALAEYVWFVPVVLKTLLLHSSSSLWADGRTERITQLSTRVTRYTILLVGVMAIGLATLADSFVPLYYGQEFEVAVLPLLLLLPGTVGFAGARPLQAINQGSGKLRVLIAATGVAAGMNLVLNALLIPAFGMNGAAVATSTSYASMFGLFVWAAWKIGYNPLEDFRAPRIAATAVLAAPVIVLVDLAIGHDILSLAIVPPVGALVYAVAAVATGAIGFDELVDLVRKFSDPLGSLVERGRALVPSQ